ncbi:MAG TPA: glucose-6-phosphate dehydrogenase [Caulobacteraceae bacterium]|jgi:glucose-6-phosphate 1-dehydrogenase|nr:glucose-6-phosphate dehydrogenase [Caulobacteraceae bacterium]
MAAAAPDCTLVIFGARGDLAKRLLVPALYNLETAHRLPKAFHIVGVDHGDCDDERLRKDLGAFLRELASDKNSEFGAAKIDARAWSALAKTMRYQKGDFEDAATYAALAKTLGDRSAIFYLAAAPRFFGPIVDQLGKAGLTHEGKGVFRRVVIEKPFGDDLASAKALNTRILKVLGEPQIFRIDHFLGKETVRNIMAVRFANGVFEPLWNRLHVDWVEITAAETVGVEKRGGYYDHAGALRDMTPNHLFQVLAMMAMEPPNSFDPEAVRAEKGRLIEAIAIKTREQALRDSVRGQYTAGTVGRRKMVAYRDSRNVDPKSNTETYVALKLNIDNWRWAGTPFYLRTGKALKARQTQAVIRFKRAPHTLFQALEPAQRPGANSLVVRIQPNEGLSLLFDVKKPGPEELNLAEVGMDFRYAETFGAAPATGYETLLYDCMTGDQTLFKRGQDIEFAWAAVMPFLEAWKGAGEPCFYKAGSEGPAEAERLMIRSGRAWRPLPS